jgi:hypothetical protein
MNNETKYNRVPTRIEGLDNLTQVALFLVLL